MRYFINFFLAFYISTVFVEISAQTQLSEIKLGQKCTKKICNYIEGFKQRGISAFNQLEASLFDTTPLNKYSVHVGSFYFDSPVEKVWKAASITNPIDIWAGKILSLSFVYDNKEDKLYFPSDLHENSLNIEQIYFISLRLLRGLFILPTALKVTKIDAEQKIIEFTYLRGGKSEGKQTLKFTAESHNKTQIIHTTYYQSGSKFRDRRLYPHFHQQAITELHNNVRKTALNIN